WARADPTAGGHRCGRRHVRHHAEQRHWDGARAPGAGLLHPQLRHQHRDVHQREGELLRQFHPARTVTECREPAGRPRGWLASSEAQSRGVQTMRGTSWAGVAVAALLLGAAGLLTVRPALATNPWGADYFPNVPLRTQDGATVHLYDDLLKGKAVAINLIYT